MTALQFKAAIASLGLTQAAAATFLGVSLRTSQKYANGAPIPKGTAMLLDLMLRDGLMPENGTVSQKPRKRATRK